MSSHRLGRRAIGLHALNRALATSSALGVVALLSVAAAPLLGLAAPAWAVGGSGGGGPAGGADDPTGPGGTFVDRTPPPGGGGGGGAGTTGGKGGDSDGAGGAGGPSAGQPGTDGESIGNNGAQGGGGGGGGAHGLVDGALPTSTAQGGKGGNGGKGFGTNSPGGGGGGGAGGFGGVVTGPVAATLGVTSTGGAGGRAGDGNVGVAQGGSGGVGLYFTPGAAGSNVTIGANVTGGDGGNGNSAGNASSGAGGAGGTGIFVAPGVSALSLSVSNGFIVAGGKGGTAFYGASGGAGIDGSNLSIVNAGAIRGGAGGNGNAMGTIGAGGVGITGSNLTIINAGEISGGLSGAGTRANAVTFTGGVNSFTITSTSQLQGYVVAASIRDTFGLGGDTTPATPFDVTQLDRAGSGLPYQGFGILEKSGSSTWTLAGRGRDPLVYQVTAGTLNLGGISRLGSSLRMIGGTLANGTLVVEPALGFDVRAGTISANLAGNGVGGGADLTKTTTGTVVLSGDNTYRETRLSGGTLRVAAASIVTGADSTITSSAIGTGALILDGGTLQTDGQDRSIYNGGTITANGGTLDSNGAVLDLRARGFSDANTATPGVLTVKDGSGTGNGLVSFGAANTYSGPTLVESGTLLSNPDGALSSASAFTVGTIPGTSARLTLQTFDQTIGSLAGNANGIVTTALVGAGFASTTTLASGGDGTSTTFAGTMRDGDARHLLAFTKAGSGSLTLSRTNTYTGDTTVSGGTLNLTGTLGNTAMTVGNGGTFSGTGTTAGAVTIQQGGTLSPGDAPAGTEPHSVGTLTVGGTLTLAAGSTAAFDLGAASTVGSANNDLVRVGGNLSVDNASKLALTAPGGGRVASGFYELFDVTGTIGPGRFGTVTNGGTNANGGVTQIVINGGALPSQYDILVANGGQLVQFWDGANQTANGAVDGGTGTWNAANTNWTTQNGQFNAPWQSQVGVFSGPAGGTVTVQGSQSFQGLQFSTNGYTLTGPGTLVVTPDNGLNSANASLTVDANVSATIAAAIGGTAGLTKFGTGSLTLSGIDTFGGTTNVTAGTLIVAAGGSLASAVTNAATFINAGTLNAGLTNTGTASNTGTINGGVVVNAGSFGTTNIVNGGITNSATVTARGQANGTLVNNAGASFTLTGALTGIKQLTNNGSVDLGGNSLSIGSLAGTNASATLSNGGTLTTGSDNSSTAYAGQINGGATRLVKIGSGTFTLSGANGFGGGTEVMAGALALASGGSLASAVQNDANATFTNAGSLNANLTNAGTARNGNVITGTVANSASFTNSGTVGGLLTNSAGTTTNTGTLNGGASVTGGTLALGSGSVVNGTVLNSATVTAQGQINGAVANNAGASFTLTGGLTGITTFRNDGTLTLAGNGLSVGGLTSTGTAGIVEDASATAATLTVGTDGSSSSYAGTLRDGSGGGALSLTKVGAGTFTLSGVNTNTGPVTGTGGTLVNAGSLAAMVVNAATFNNSGTVSGGLTNTGTVTASGGRIDGAIANNAGSFTVTGTVASNGNLANASGATVSIAATGNYTLAGLITNAGTLGVASGGRLTAGGINNSGMLTVAAGGTVVDALTNTNTVSNAGTYTADATNAVGGTLTNTGTFSTLSQPFQNAGTLITTGVLNGGLTNTGSVQASGQLNGALANGGTVQLTGATTGITTLANNGLFDLGGTALSVSALSGSNVNAVLRNGTLTTGGDNSSTTYAGSLADGASPTSLTKIGGGTLSLTGTSTYSGGTIINGGALVAMAASLGSGPIANNTMLVLDQPSDASLANAINGTGMLLKQGAGTLTYTGAGALTGQTGVAAGGFVVNGSLASSSVTVGDTAFVGGTGTIGGLAVLSGATAAPGASLAVGSLGTLNVAGNVFFATGSTYRVDATASGQADRISTIGAAGLQGGTVQVTAGTGQYAPRTTYTILSATGGLSGRFDSVTSNFAFLTPFLTYDANDAYLTLARNDMQFTAVAVSRNQGNVALAVQNGRVGSRLYDAVSMLSSAQARQAFDALSGEIHASAVSAQFATASLVREAILDRLRFGELPAFGLGADGIGQRFAPGTTLPATYTADLPGRAAAPSPVTTQLAEPSPVAVWGTGFGAFGSIGGDGNAVRLDQQTSGFVLGADIRLDNTWRIGAAGGYSFTTLDVSARQSHATIESGFGALYAGASFGPLQLRLGGSYAGTSLATSRAVIFPGFSESESARYGGEIGQTFGELGYRIGSSAGYIEPFVGAAAIRISRDGFTERGGAGALVAGARDYDLATSTIGMQVQGQLSSLFDTDTPIFVRGLVGYRRAYGDVVPSALFGFASTGQAFLAAGVPVARDALVTEAGLDWQVAARTTLSINYTGQIGTDRTQVHAVKGGLVYRW